VSEISTDRQIQMILGSSSSSVGKIELFIGSGNFFFLKMPANVIMPTSQSHFLILSHKDLSCCVTVA
jgi:hypothetical protein